MNQASGLRLQASGLALLISCAGDAKPPALSEVELSVRILVGSQLEATQPLLVRLTSTDPAQDLEVRVPRSGQTNLALGSETNDFKPAKKVAISIGAAKSELPPQVNLVGHTRHFDAELNQTLQLKVVLGKGDRFSRAAVETFDGAAGATSLGDGRVVLFGGARASRRVGIYDHTCGQILFDQERCSGTGGGVIGTLPPLVGASYTALPGGRAFIYGGMDAASEYKADGYFFDPGTMSITKVIDGGFNPPNGRAYHAAAYVDGLQGQVAIVGGKGPNGPLATFLLIKPETGSVSSGPLLTAPDGSTEPRFEAVAAPLGKKEVLVAGGVVAGQPAATALVLRESSPGSYFWAYPERADSLGARATMLASRVRHTLTPLPDGSVLVYGGSDGSSSVALPEVYSENHAFPGAFFSPTDPDFAPADKRESHTTAIVARRDGGVVVALGGKRVTEAGLPSYGLPAYVFRMGPPGWENAGRGAPLTASSLLGAPAPRMDPVATTLPDGSALVTGGEIKVSTLPAGMAELLVECGQFWTCIE